MASSKVCTAIPSSDHNRQIAAHRQELGDLAHARNLGLCQRAEFDFEPHAGLSNVVLLLPVRMQFANPADHLFATINLRRASGMQGRMGCCNKMQLPGSKQSFDIRFYVIKIHWLWRLRPIVQAVHRRRPTRIIAGVGYIHCRSWKNKHRPRTDACAAVCGSD